MTRCYNISKQVVWEAYKSVKENHGAAGIDGKTIQEFETNAKDELYKLWNKMCSGSYFPSAVRAVEIPKKQGGCRILGIPTITDRIAQAVVKLYLEPRLEKVFHSSSFGYRPGKSAHDAISQARIHCWRNNWVIDLDIKAFFDNLNHELMMKALERHVTEKWILLYIERWLKTPLENAIGEHITRDKGTPQGGVISPLLANLYLHYTFDKRMEREFPDIKFERYADDIIIHCKTQKAAEWILKQASRRFMDCKLQVHPEKTKIVLVEEKRFYNKRKVGMFDFLGFTFRPRLARSRTGVLFTSVLPAISKESASDIRNKIRAWKIQLHTSSTLEDIANYINPTVRGWINYYGAFYKSALIKPLKMIQERLVMWARRKYKNLKQCPNNAWDFILRIAKERPKLFAHWQLWMSY